MLHQSAPHSSTVYPLDRYRFKVKQYLVRAREIFKQNAALLVAYFAIAAILTAGTFSIIFLIPTKLGLALMSLVALLLLPPVWAGFFTGIFPILSNERATFKDFFRGFSYLPHLAIANSIAALLIFAGSVISLIVIPGLYLIVGYIFAAPLMVDRRLKFWQALETSRLVIAQQWFRAFAFILLLFALNLCGALFFGLGLIVTVPLSYCAIAIAYQDIIGLRNEERLED